MANQEHIEILKQGIQEWNKWRKENPNIKPDLNGPITKRLIFGLDKGVDVEAINFSEADLNNSDFRGANLTNVSLNGSNLEGADFTEAYLFVANLRGAKLKSANFRDAFLVGTSLKGADLRGANFFKAFAQRADFSSTNMINAELRHTDLTESNLSHADLSRSYMGHTILEGNDLSLTKGLDTIFHFDGPSIIGVNTIYKSKGGIPKIFLRNAGVPEDIITYAITFKDKEVKHYSCFISYSSKDKEFVERLRNDLKKKDVQCWLAPEDLRAGDKFREEIYKSIWKYDKVIVLLSENSLLSPFVEEEIVLARHREEKEGKPVLVPIRIDDAVMESDKEWAVVIRAKLHLGDFRLWKNPDSYQKSFDRLLNDLTTKESNPSRA